MSLSQDSQQFDSSLIGQRQQRLAKVKQLRELGIDPYPAVSHKSHSNQEVIDRFDQLQNTDVSVTGRVMSWREHGQLAFADLQDESGTLQLYFKGEELEATNTENQTLGWELLNLIDIGDFVEAHGKVVKTESGQISVLVKQLKVLVKTIRPIPAQWTGITDKEERFRRRYLDLVVNPEVRARYARRAAFWQAHRDFFNERGFHEINIPILEHIPGGGDAVPFVTHMNAIDEDFYLRISHELPLKRLIGGGYEKVYDIGARFRNEGLSDEHLPEHVAMEFYWAYADWREGMKMIQELFDFVIARVYGDKKVFTIRGFEVDFSKPWEEIDFATIMHEKYGIKDLYNVKLDELTPLLDEHQISYNPQTINVPRAVDSLWKKLRKDIVGPAFLVNHPKYLSPLQKPSLENPQMVERFQPLIAGSELGNGWSEVNDPVDQYERFVEQQEMRDSGDDEAQWLDIDYVEMLEYGMAPNFGYGHSERVFWFLEDVTAREGVPFPQLKFHIGEDTKKIYPEIDFDNIRNSKVELSEEPVEVLDENLTLVDRNQALEFLHKYVQDTYQRHHAEMVASAMEAVAKKLGEPDSERFYITGLVHDWDFDKWPTEHPGRYEQLSEETGADKYMIDAIKGHADLSFLRTTNLSRALIACDELSGLFYAYHKMVGSYSGMKISSLQKKIHKEVNFAAKISREDVITGINELGLPEEELLELLRDTFAKLYD